MAFRRFTRAFRYTNEKGREIMIPRGWAGELSGPALAAADDAGATVKPEDPPKSKAKAKG